MLTPGASTAVVLRNSLAGGVRAGVLAAAGTNTGSIGYGLLTAFGFAVALHRWPSAWGVLRLAGVAYLGWLGLQSLRRALAVSAAPPRTAIPPVAPPRWRPFIEGFLTNALNPSVAMFYLLLLPQFVPPGAPIARSVLLLTALHVGLAVTWHLTWAVAGGTLAHRLAGGRTRQVLEGMTGLALLALAARLAAG